METTVTAALAFLPAVVPICIWVAWSDLARMKIPNKAVIALVIAFLAIGFFVFPATEVLWRLVNLAVVLAVTFLLSTARLLGAGDAKFAAAMAPYVAVSDITFLIAIFVVTVLLGFASHRLARATPALRNMAPNWESWERTRDFPLGYPLAATLILYLGLIAIGY